VSNLTDLADAASTQLQVVVAAGTVVDLTNQRDADVAADTTLLTGVCNQAARKVRRRLGDVSDTDDDAVDFAVRFALLDLATFHSLTFTDGGMAYVAGVERDLAEEAKARRQANSVYQLSLEDITTHDDRWDEETWDESADGTY
jgi:hypothetical protein